MENKVDLFIAKCNEWERQVAAIKVLQASERALRLEILKEKFGDNNVGSKSAMAGNLVIKGTFGLEYKIDSKGFAKAIADDNIPDEAMDGIRIKYELDKKGYDALDDENKKIIGDYLTVKPTLPALEIKVQSDD